MRARHNTFLVLLAGTAMAASSVQNAAHAGVITTQEYLAAADRAAMAAKVDALLARDEVRAQLERLGVDAAAAAARVDALTDQELQLLAENIESLPAGGDALGVVGIVFLVLLILELVGVIDIFNKI
jgi:hypothetical protein